jgi:hypothetical protein
VLNGMMMDPWCVHPLAVSYAGAVWDDGTLKTKKVMAAQHLAKKAAPQHPHWTYIGFLMRS